MFERKFDKNGLKYSFGQLDTALKKLRRGELRGIKDVAKYADAICVFSIKNPDHPDSCMKDGIDQAIRDIRIEAFDAASVNMTGFGNMAYVVIHHPDLAIRTKALHVLHACYFAFDRTTFCQSIEV